MQVLIDYFGVKDLIPHGYCLSWSPALLWTHVISDLLIMLAYYSIPLTLVYFIRQRKDVPYSRMVAMFAGFIVACGTMHLLAIITIWIPLYWLDALFKSFTAIISVATALLIIKVIPHALSMPNSAQLQDEMQQRKIAEEALCAAHLALQQNSAHTQLLLDSALDGIISMDQKLRDSDAFNASILNSLTSHIAVLDANGTIIAVNNAWRQFAEESGLSAPGRDMLGRSYLDACENACGEGASPTQAGIMAVLRGELEIFHLEYPCCLSSKPRWFHMTVLPLQGTRRGVVVSHKNITERKKAEEAVQVASRYARSLIEASQDPLVTISAEGKVTDVNTATEQVTGVNRENLIGSDFADYFTDPEKARAGYQQVFLQGFVTDYPLAIRHVSGKVTDVLYNASVYRDGNGNVLGVFAAARDITERKIMEDELKNSEAKFRSIIEVSPVPMALNDQQLNLTFLNPAFVQTFGYIVADIPTVADWRLKAFPDPDYRRWVESTWQTTLVKTKQEQTDFPPLEVAVRCKDNSTKTVLVTAAAIHDDVASMRLVVLYDITQRKQIEAELTRSNADLEQFAYAVSHDMRQPLRMVSSYLSLIESALADQLDDETQQFLNFAIDGAKRMDAMILSLLDYSRIGRKFEAKTWISSKASLDEALAFLNPELNTGGGEIKVTGEWPELFASRDELTRLLQNLIGNALKYHEENQPPEVHVHGKVCGELLRVEVRDYGIGIEPSQLDRLFKVFSRLQARSRFEGSGVGLALCRRIVEHHDGAIGVESDGEGQGSLFWFELPIVNAENPG